MAHTETLSDTTLDEIALQVGSLYPRFVGDPKRLQQPGELKETFPIWIVGADDVIAGMDDIAKIAQNTGRWHSQISTGGSAQAAARSISLGGDPANWQVRQIIEGNYAQQIDQEIDWVDSNAVGDPLVRLLEIPAFRITAFWLIQTDNSNAVVLVNAPSNAQFLQKRKIYQSKAFMDALRKEQFVIGIQP